jgi:putative mycofactocin binding protein MftB
MDPLLITEVAMTSRMVYVLADGVKVRREIFGLLFYNYRGPRLYFLPCRDLLDTSFFNGRQSVAELIRAIRARHNWPRQWIEERVNQVLTLLESKGLVHGQSIC